MEGLQRGARRGMIPGKCQGGGAQLLMPAHSLSRSIFSDIIIPIYEKKVINDLQNS
jgi:hypothetical protein